MGGLNYGTPLGFKKTLLREQLAEVGSKTVAVGGGKEQVGRFWSVFMLYKWPEKEGKTRGTEKYFLMERPC